MLQPVRRITNVNATLQRGVAAADSLFMIMDENDEEDTGTSAPDTTPEPDTFAFDTEEEPSADEASGDEGFSFTTRGARDRDYGLFIIAIQKLKIGSHGPECFADF